jgi:hypothetical protein
VIGKPITIIIPAELHAEEQQILDKLRRGERIDHFDTVRVTKDSRRIAISLTVSPVRAADADLLDISRITRGTLELKKTRTELTSIIGATRLLVRCWKPSTTSWCSTCRPSPCSSRPTSCASRRCFPTC